MPPTGLDSPTTIDPARITALRVAAGFVVTLLALNIVLDVTDTVLVPRATFETLHDTATADDPLIALSDRLGLLLYGAFVATAIAFITWLYIARKNLDRWRIRALRWGPGWAIGAWILPLANLVLPAVVVNTVVRGSRTPSDEVRAPRHGSVLIWLWWLTYLAAGVGSLVFASRTFNETDSIGTIAAYDAAGTVPDILAATLAIAVVGWVTRLQSRRHAVIQQLYVER
jgi:hypothetical protein